MAKKFRLPRKTKKALKGHFWLYPSDEKGHSLMADPTKNKEDYVALKQGVLRDISRGYDSEERRRKRDLLNKRAEISDEQLREWVDEIFREEMRDWAYNRLTEAKKHKRAVVAYYNFINGYRLYKDGNRSYGNICAMSADRARYLLLPDKFKVMKRDWRERKNFKRSGRYYVDPRLSRLLRGK